MNSRNSRPFISTAVLTLLGRAGGFLIPFLIAAFFGASREVDAFFFVYSIIFAIVGVFTYTFESVLTPFLVAEKKTPENAHAFANGVLISTLPWLLAFCVATAFLLKPILIQTGSWEPENATTASRLFTQMLPLLLLSVWGSQANSLFFLYRIFWLPALSPLIRSLVVIGILWGLHALWGVYSLSFGFVIGEGVRWGMLIVGLLWMTPWRLRWVSARSEGVRKFYKEAGFQIMALVAVHLIIVADQWFASRLQVGDVSLLSYADRLLQIPYTLFLFGFLQIFATDWSESYYHQPETFWKKTQKDIWNVFVISTLLTLVMGIFRKEIVNIVFMFSRLSDHELHVISEIFGCFLIGFVPGIIRLLYGRILIVLRKSRFYCFQCWVELGLNILLNAFFAKRYGVAGIALATSAIYTITTLWQFFLIKRYSKKGMMR